MKKRIIVALGLKAFTLLGMVGAEANGMNENAFNIPILDEGKTIGVPLLEKNRVPKFERNAMPPLVMLKNANEF